MSIFYDPDDFVSELPPFGEPMTKTLAKKKLLGFSSKVRLPTREASIKVGQKRGMRTYHCEYCLGWHLTTKKVKTRPTKKIELND